MTINIIVSILFIISYLVMAIGKIPKSSIGRAEVALVAGLIILVLGAIPAKKIIPSLELPTLFILLVLMLISGILKVAGFYDYCATWITNHKGSSNKLLFLVIIIAGVLSALLANDIIAFAMTPILCKGLQQRDINPKPFLIGLMSACNAGSAATIIGNPQNLLIAQTGNLNFLAFLKVCGPIAIVSLAVVYILTYLIWHKSLHHSPTKHFLDFPNVNKIQSYLGLFFVAILIITFLSPIPRIYSSIFIFILICITRFTCFNKLIKTIDWRLLILFIGLFLVNAGFDHTGIPERAIVWLQQQGFVLKDLSILTPFSFIATNTIGNVPAVIMTLSLWPTHDTNTLYALSIMMTLAGNGLLFGSMANIIVVERAQQVGTSVSFWEHLTTGLPITLVSMGIAWVILLLHI